MLPLLIGWGLVVLALGELRVVELTTSTWDMGVYQQALWSASHGRGFYDAPDVETGGFSSFLQVHTAFVLYAVVPIYALWPTETTLLVVQAAVVAGAAVPLYLLARDIVGSQRRAQVAVLLYLAWTPTLDGVLYDFHAEAFLPVEFFALVLLWNRGRYGWGGLVALLSFLSFDIAPVLVAMFALLWALPARWPDRLPRTGADLRAWLTGLRRHLGARRTQLSLVLAGASAFAYGFLLELRTTWLSAAVGLGPVPTLGRGYVIGATPSALGLSFSYVGIDLAGKVEYWLLLYGLLLFLPLLGRRYALLPLPWVAYSFLSYNGNYTVLGFQYGLIAAGPVFVGLVYGLKRVEGKQVLALWHRLTRRRGTAGSEGAARLLRDPGRAGRALPLAGAALVAGLLLVNVALSPADPATQYTFEGSAYQISYDPPGSWASAEHVVGALPVGASVVASVDLFPLVADDDHAWSLHWDSDPTLWLPFGPTELPPYVLISEERLYTCPAWLLEALDNSTSYGVLASATGTPSGAVTLYEAGYAGPAEVFGPAVSATDD